MSTCRRFTMQSVVVGAVALLAACADSSITTSTANAPSVPSITAPFEGSTPASAEQIDPGLKPFIDLAVTDLATRLSIDATEVGVSSATLVEWPDSSLGCPQPGQQYAQVSTDGALIVLTADNNTYRYHAGGSTTPFLCEPPPKTAVTTGAETTGPNL